MVAAAAVVVVVTLLGLRVFGFAASRVVGFQVDGSRH